MPAQPIVPEQILAKAMASEMISVQQLHHLIQFPQPLVVLLDVRTPTEQQLGVIPGSMLFPCDHDLNNLDNTTIFAESFHSRFRPEQFDPTAYYILICRTGPRTAIALEVFLQHNLFACELLGGITEWQHKGLALQPPSA